MLQPVVLKGFRFAVSLACQHKVANFCQIAACGEIRVGSVLNSTYVTITDPRLVGSPIMPEGFVTETGFLLRDEVRS